MRKHRGLSVFAMGLVLLLMSSLPAAVGVAEESNAEPAKKVLCTATLEDEFTEDSVLVVINKSASKINKKHPLSAFPYGYFSEVKDLSFVDGDVTDKEYVNTEDFQQVLQLTLKKPGKEEVLKAIQKLEKLDWVESAEPNYIGHFDAAEEERAVIHPDEPAAAGAANAQTESAGFLPNDPLLSQQYALAQSNAYLAWEMTTGDRSVRVGIIDSGIADHEDLRDNLVAGWDFVNDNDTTTDDELGHGTRVAGIIGAVGNNSRGVTGVCWNVSLVPLQVSYWVRENGRNVIKFNAVAVSKAIQYAANNDIPIINCSFGIWSSSNFYEAVMRNYKGLIVCSAGNEGRNNDEYSEGKLHYPSSSTLDNVLAVANVTQAGELAANSNYGAVSVDIAAYGDAVLTTGLGDTYEYRGGTSYAAPYVAGTAALMKSYRPDLDALTIREILLTTGNMSAPLLGKVAATQGIVDTYGAVAAVYQFAPPPEVLFGDVNGDGRTDLVSRGKHGEYSDGYINIQFATAAPGFGRVSSSGLKVVNYNDDLWLQDVNGDGKDDLVCRVGAGQWDTGYLYVGLSNGSGFDYWSYSSEAGVVNENDTILFGDVNGDGRQDVICRGAVTRWDEGHIYVGLSTGTGFSLWSFDSDGRVVNPGDRLWVGDVNGDGRDDLICEGDFDRAGAGYIYTALSNGSGFTFWSSSTGRQVLKNVDDRVMVGDVNGDGRADLMVQTGLNAWDTGYIWTALSQGSSFAFWSYDSGANVVNERDEVLTGDVNGDGQTDLIVRGGSGNWDEGYLYTALSNGSGFTFWTADTGKKVVNPRDRVVMCDVDHDFREDVVAVGGYGYEDQGRLRLALSGGSSFTFWTWSGGTVGM